MINLGPPPQPVYYQKQRLKTSKWQYRFMVGRCMKGALNMDRTEDIAAALNAPIPPSERVERVRRIINAELFKSVQARKKELLNLKK